MNQTECQKTTKANHFDPWVRKSTKCQKRLWEMTDAERKIAVLSKDLKDKSLSPLFY